MELLSASRVESKLNIDPETVKLIIEWQKKLTKCRFSVFVFEVKCIWEG